MSNLWFICLDWNKKLTCLDRTFLPDLVSTLIFVLNAQNQLISPHISVLACTDPSCGGNPQLQRSQIFTLIWQNLKILTKILVWNHFRQNICWVFIGEVILNLYQTIPNQTLGTGYLGIWAKKNHGRHQVALMFCALFGLVDSQKLLFSNHMPK